jgi:hypothetical protein
VSYILFSFVNLLTYEEVQLKQNVMRKTRPERDSPSEKRVAHYAPGLLKAKSALGVSRGLAGALETGLLALFYTCVASQETTLTQGGA